VREENVMLSRNVAMAGAVVALMLALPGSAMAGSARAEQVFECDASRICLYDLAGGTGDKKTINVMWEGGFALESSGWANRTTSVRNNEEYTLTLLDGKYGDCVVLDTVAPGESKTLSPAADNKTDLVDWTHGNDSCDVR
jgi:hypothetical protein